MADTINEDGLLMNPDENVGEPIDEEPNEDEGGQSEANKEDDLIWRLDLTDIFSKKKELWHVYLEGKINQKMHQPLLNIII